MNFIFDVDGTLTPSRTIINEEFGSYLKTFTDDHNCYLVTGSDRYKTLEQLGEGLYNSFKKVYQCSGNDVWIKDKNVYTSKFKMSDHMHDILHRELKASQFPMRSGKHIDIRPGLVNFSIVGRNATYGERKMYIEYDKKSGERERLARKFNDAFPQHWATVAGETGLDIVKIGEGKAQIVKELCGEKMIFFGDQCQYGGNDWEIAREIMKYNGKVYHVNDWDDTFNRLLSYETVI